MALVYKESEGGVTFILSGNAGMESAPLFHRGLVDNLGKRITIDMKKADSVDTSIIHLIIAAMKAMQLLDIALCIVAPPKALLEILSREGFGGEIRTI